MVPTNAAIEVLKSSIKKEKKKKSFLVQIQF